MTDERVIIEREVFIAALPETLFRFLVNPALMARWIGIKHTLEPQPGGVFRVEVSEDNIARGRFTEVLPNPASSVHLGLGVEGPISCSFKSGRLYRGNRS